MDRYRGLQRLGATCLKKAAKWLSNCDVCVSKCLLQCVQRSGEEDCVMDMGSFDCEGTWCV